MPNYQWVTLSNAVAALAGRLADPTNVFWSQPELTLYIQEALSTWNALTEQWNADFVWTPDSSQVWYNVDQLPNSPRVRTLTDVDLYTSMEYMLLEPPSGGTWTGTSQFSISDLSGALQRRRDEMIQESGCNLSQLPAINTTPNTRRIFFPDSTLEPRRARWVPVSGSPQTLSRGDNLGWDSFEAAHLQQTGTPYSWSVIAGPSAGDGRRHSPQPTWKLRCALVAGWIGIRSTGRDPAESAERLGMAGEVGSACRSSRKRIGSD